MFLNLTGNKISTLVIGGKKAAYIKVKTLLKSGGKVQCISKEFNKELKSIRDENLLLITGSFNREFLTNKHLVVIAIDDDIEIENIMKLCDKMSILYINCKSPEKGNVIMPCEGYTKSISFGININSKNPKGSIFIKNIIEENLLEYDDFILRLSDIRNKLKNNKNKDRVLEFITSKDFKFFYDKGKEKILLSLFFSRDVIDLIF